MRHLLPLILLLTACASTKEAPQKPQRGTLPDWEDKVPQQMSPPPTHYDTVRNMHQQYRHTTSQIKNYPF